MTPRLLTEQHLEFLSLSGGCTGSSEFTLVKMTNCWKSHNMGGGGGGLDRLIFKHAFSIRVVNSVDPDQMIMIYSVFEYKINRGSAQGQQFNPRVINLLVFCSSYHLLQFDMPHDHVWKK